MNVKIGQSVCLIKSLNLFKREGAIGSIIKKEHGNYSDWIEVEFAVDGINSFDFLGNVFCFTDKDISVYLTITSYIDFQDKINDRIGIL